MGRNSSHSSSEDRGDNDRKTRQTEQGELLDDLEPLAGTAVPRPLLHFDPLGIIEFE